MPRKRPYRIVLTKQEREELERRANKYTLPYFIVARFAALLLADLGVTKTRSRHHVSDDNPFSESQVKTLKYRPEFPERFGSI